MTLTLHQLQLSIKSALSERFPLAVWVTAEISDLKVNYSGHCYLELVEKREGDSLAVAQSRAVIWRSNYQMLSSYFRAQTGQEIAVGIKVLVKVLVNFHELYGLSLQITDIDPSFTLGDTERQRQITIEQLRKDGVWDMNRQQPMARLVQRVAIISSANAAGYQDFCNEIARSGYHFELSLFDAFMQGAGAEESIVAALEAIAISAIEFDAVVIIRGGGSVGDLQCFNSYRMASHVAQFPLPIIAGIGHDKDVSIVDMVAAHSLKTPTAVATWLVERMSLLEGWLDAAALSLHDSAMGITRNHIVLLESHSTALKARAEQLLALQRSRLEGLAAAVELHSPDHLLRLGYAVARVGSVALSSGGGLQVGDEISVEVADALLTAQITKKSKK